MQYGTPVRMGIRWGNGSYSVSAYGGMQSQTYNGFVPTALRLGVTSGVQSLLNGRFLNLWAGDFVPSDAKFIAACQLGADVDNVIRT